MGLGLLTGPWTAVHLLGPKAPPRGGVLQTVPHMPRLSLRRLPGCGGQAPWGRAGGRGSQSCFPIFQFRWTVGTITRLMPLTESAGEKELKLPQCQPPCKGEPGGLALWPAPGRKKEMFFHRTREAKEPWLIKEKRRGKNLPPPPSLSHMHQAKPHSLHSPSLPHSASFLRYQRLSSSLQREGKLQGPKLHISQSTCHRAKA